MNTYEKDLSCFDGGGAVFGCARCTANLTVDGTLGDQRTEDGVLITTTEPAGFGDEEEFRLYLPGKKITDLPEDFRNWTHLSGWAGKVGMIKSRKTRK